MAYQMFLLQLSCRCIFWKKRCNRLKNMNQFLEAQKERTVVQKSSELLNPFKVQVNVSKIVLKEVFHHCMWRIVIAFLT